MIILIDNKNFMIRLCKDSEEYHGFDVSFPGWKELTKFLSDIGFTVLLSGPVAEKFLDDEGLYYIHVEHVAKESFFKFERRLNRLIKENQKYLDTSMSFGKLMFAIARDGSKGTIHSNNLMEIWRMNDDHRFYINSDMDIDDLVEILEGDFEKLLTIEKKVAKELGCEGIEELSELSDEVDYALEDFVEREFENLFSASNYHDALINVLVICEMLAK